MKGIFDIYTFEIRINELIQQYKTIPEDSLLQSHWSRYLCILSAGYLETSVRKILSSYAQRKAAPNILNYVENRLKFFQSAKMKNIIQLIGLFNKEWAEELDEKTKGELAQAVDSIVSNRHNIAHGKNTGISYVYFQEWHKKVVKVVHIIEKICLGENGGE